MFGCQLFCFCNDRGKKLLLILIPILCWNCNVYKPVMHVSEKTIRGKLIDGGTGEILIGQSVFEYDRTSNNVLTDTLGYFELDFLGNNPIIGLAGFYEPLFIEINPGKFNEIVLNSKVIKTSKRIFKKISKFKNNESKKYTKISLKGTWEVVEVNKFINSQWEYLDEIESGFINKKLNRLFPCELRKSNLLTFKVDENLIVNAEIFQFNRGDNYLSLTYSDMVYMYRYEFINENTFSFRKQINLGEVEWVIKRLGS